MANSNLNKLQRRFVPICMAIAMLACMSAPAANLKQSTADIEVESDGAEVDARTKQLVLPNVRITQDGYAIEAQEARATGLSFDNSQWTFTGNVRISTPDGFSTADTAKVLFVQNAITELHITGRPATFEQHDTGKQTMAQGRAGNIDYDLQKNTVRLSQQAWVKYGQNEASSNVLVYDVNTQSVRANAAEQQGERVRITINPNTGQTTTAPKKSADAKP